MSFASEKLFDGYMRTNMPGFASKVKVREIVPHLPCLTLSDREEIEAKREHSGNYTAMQLLLECLHRRESWPEQFITALTACEHRAMAAEMEAAYQRLKNPGGEPPADPRPPPATVVMATVHSPPPVCPSDPAGAGSPVSRPRKGSFSGPGAQTSPSPQQPSTPPPSTEIPRLSPQARLPPRQEPEENSEASGEFVGAAAGSGFAAGVGAGCEVPAETGGPARPVSGETWRSAEQSGPPSACGDDSSEDPDSASVAVTPEKLPVQDSDPPKLSDPAQVKGSPCFRDPSSGPKRRRHRGGGGGEATANGRGEEEEDDDLFFSKPGVLLSVRPSAAQQQATLPNATLPESSFTWNNISLEISDPEPEGSGARSQGPEGSPGSPPQGGPDDLASFAEREAQEVLEYVGHVMEEPSVQNLASPAQGILGNAVHAPQDPRGDEKSEGQLQATVVQSASSSSAPSPQILNGKPTPAVAREPVPARQQPSAAKAPRGPDDEASAVCVSSRTKYVAAAVAAAAGMAACAMFVAWRLRR
ncbi:unnamed protein product [Lota lota]